MLITKRYFKKSMGFIIAVIMIIAGFTVFSTEVYADSYKISTEVDVALRKSSSACGKNIKSDVASSGGDARR